MRFIGSLKSKFIRTEDHLVEYGGFPFYFKGLVKYYISTLLYLLYGFDRWHIRPVEWKPYALEAAKYVSFLAERESLRTVVEVGCGLGGILSRIRNVDRVGFDIDKKVIRAARILNRGIEFRVGEFCDISNLDIDILVVVNFPHMISPKELSRKFADIIKNNGIKYLLVEIVRYENWYYHDYDKILGSGWLRIWESKKFSSDRQVLCYKNASMEASLS